MVETSYTFIDQLCNDSDGQSWERLVEVYRPLLRGWIGRYDVQSADADDLIQDVLMVAIRELPTEWLRTHGNMIPYEVVDTAGSATLSFGN